MLHSNRIVALAARTCQKGPLTLRAPASSNRGWRWCIQQRFSDSLGGNCPYRGAAETNPRGSIGYATALRV